ncbi:hypothetical protein BGW39_006607 [Mortierella sp. 14UC]|nr:hypothetical protein BGW39_006607 [Mortierella sp. 14UC]
MATSNTNNNNNNNDAIHFDNDGNIVPAAQINMAQRDNRPAATVVMSTAELVHHIVQYLPASSYRSCSFINHMWRAAVLYTSLSFHKFDRATKQNFEATPKRIYILNAFILQYSPSVDLGIPTDSSSHQFVFSCQARSGSIDSYGSSSNSDGKSGGGESSVRSHLQRHHTHQPGHDLEPFHSFHTYQSSTIVPNIYIRTGFQLAPHLSSPPPLPRFPSPAQQHTRTTGFLPGNPAPSTSQTTMDQLLEFPPPQHSPSNPSSSTDTTGPSSSYQHSYEAAISTDSDMSSSIMADGTDLSLSSGQILPLNGLSTFPTSQQQQPQSTTPPLPSSSPSSSTGTITSGIPIPSPRQLQLQQQQHQQQQHQHQQQQQQQHLTLRVVPCPYDLPTEAQMAMQYEENNVMLKKGSRTSTGSGQSAGSTSSNNNSSSGESGNNEFLQGSYLPYASPIMEESSGPSDRVYVGRYDAGGAVVVGSNVMMGPSGSGRSGQQGSSASQFQGDNKRAAAGYQRSVQEQELRQQHQQQRRQHGNESHDIPMALASDLMMDMTVSTDRRRGSSVTTGTTSSSSYGSNSTPQQQQYHQHHDRNHRHNNHHYTESYSIPASTCGSNGDRSHHHHHSHPPKPTRPKRNWSMTVQTYYYERSALNAMIVACREHMESPEGQRGTIVEMTDTTRIIWNETTRQEHIWTITPTLMDRTNPGDFIEKDYDPHSYEHDSEA